MLMDLFETVASLIAPNWSRMKWQLHDGHPLSRTYRILQAKPVDTGALRDAGLDLARLVDTGGENGKAAFPLALVAKTLEPVYREDAVNISRVALRHNQKASEGTLSARIILDFWEDRLTGGRVRSSSDAMNVRTEGMGPPSAQETKDAMLVAGVLNKMYISIADEGVLMRRAISTIGDAADFEPMADRRFYLNYFSVMHARNIYQITDRVDALLEDVDRATNPQKMALHLMGVYRHLSETSLSLGREEHSWLCEKIIARIRTKTPTMDQHVQAFVRNYPL